VQNISLIIIGKFLSAIFQLFNLGNGSTWPGHIALSINKSFIRQILKNSNTKIIIVAGTNGKTTTSSLIASVLNDNGKRVILNNSGANLLNGIASALILSSSTRGQIGADYAIFEIDENNLPLILNEVTPDYLILLNLFRDQLDRYGEINTIATNWKDAISSLTTNTTLILNADDPQIAHLANITNAKAAFFSRIDLNQENKNPDHSSDSTYCPNCGKKLSYKTITFSHLGNWHCENCNLRRPEADLADFPLFPLTGIYNEYNTLAAVLALKHIGLKDKDIVRSLESFKPSFGRQEILKYKNKNVQIFLSKNPTSFNQSLKAILDLGAKKLLLVLNDRIPDGRDVSWIWDTDIKGTKQLNKIFISGDRVYDMALRLKYELGIKNYESKTWIYEELKQAIEEGIKSIEDGETLYILPTYSAMLDCRKILTGKKIL
jgi:lipid II isoglutaminyl synthase (glutamine-hydrolysing)